LRKTCFNIAFRYGRRKTWVAIGAIIVSVTFYFVFSGCGKCQRFFRSEGTVWDVLYGAFLTGSFNVGWAAIQVK
jgi:Na+/melibiose symporter-like transporter